MSDFDKDDYLSDADDLNKLSHQAGPNGSPDSPAAGSDRGGQDPDQRRRGAGAPAEDSTAESSRPSGEGSGRPSHGQDAHDGSIPVDGSDQGQRAPSAAASASGGSAGSQDSGEPAKKPEAGADASGAQGSGNSKDSDSKDSDSKESKGPKDSLTELGKAKKEAADYLEALQRERADFINYRNRMDKEKRLARDYGIQDVLTALLPALDDLDRLREHGGMSKEIETVSKQLDRGFRKFKIEKFGQKGEKFDPSRHEAILHRTSPEVDTEQIDAVVEAGYSLNGRILRAAKVVVVAPEEKSGSGQESGSSKPSGAGDSR